MNRDEILASNSLKTQKLDIPEFGGEITIRELTVAKAGEFNAEHAKLRNEDGHIANVLWVIAGVVNDDGTPAFTRDDIPQLLQMNMSAMRRISDAVIRLNGIDISPDDIQKNS